MFVNDEREELIARVVGTDHLTMLDDFQTLDPIGHDAGEGALYLGHCRVRDAIEFDVILT